MPSPDHPASPVALTIAGSDCSSGAGLQADLKAFTAQQVYGLTAVTCVVSEIPGKVSRIQTITPAVIADQLEILLGAFPVAAIKTGMLYSREVVTLVHRIFTALPAKRRPHLIVDPVMIATSGDPLIKPAAIRAYQDLLFPAATLITPNMDEAAVLLGSPIHDESDLAAAAETLHQRYGCSVLVKGGHLRSRTATDILRDPAGTLTLTAPFVPGVSTHGTGCTFSAAIAAAMARGQDLRAAVTTGKHYVNDAIASSFRWGRGRTRVDALNHFVAPRS